MHKLFKVDPESSKYDSAHVATFSIPYSPKNNSSLSSMVVGSNGSVLLVGVCGGGTHRCVLFDIPAQYQNKDVASIKQDEKNQRRRALKLPFIELQEKSQKELWQRMPLCADEKSSSSGGTKRFQERRRSSRLAKRIRSLK